MESMEIIQFDPNQHMRLMPAIVDMHADCIEADGALLRFHPPFTPEKRSKMESFWKERTNQISHGRRITFLALHRHGDQEDLGGLVELGMPEADTGPFRGDVEMLMVSPKHRRKGLANKLMHELETVAKQRGRTLLQLATDVGSTAEQFVYPRLGYTKIGVVPNFGISPIDGSLKDGAYFYKHLTPVPIVP